MKIALVLLLIVGGFSLRLLLENVYTRMQESKQTASVDTDNDFNEGGVGRNLGSADCVPEDDPKMLAFKEQFAGKEILVSGAEDLTDDGMTDVVVIYRDGEYAMMVVGVDPGDGENYEFTEPVLAPRDNQTLRFFNMDKEGEMEFVVQGEKNGKTGYGIFRLIDGAPVNLFAEGMEEC